MKTIYIPKGETVCYESLETERLVVMGCLKVTYGISAKTISGDGVLFAQTIHADDIRAREIDAGSVICNRLLANQAQVQELVAVERAAVSTFLAAQTVKTARLTVTASEVDEVEAEEVVNLGAKKRSLFGLLLISALRSLWAILTAPAAREVKPLKKQNTHDDDDYRGGSAGDDDDPVMREKIAKTVREIMEKEKASATAPNEGAASPDMAQMQNIFQMLRDQGCMLQIVPGKPEDITPFPDFNAAATDAA